MNFLTDKIIIVYYPNLAGGKFLSNCIALSKNALPQSSIISLLDLNFYNKDKSQILEHIEKKYNLLAGVDWPKLNDFYIGTYSVNAFIQQELDHPMVKFLKWAYGKCSDINQDYYSFKLESILKSLPPKIEQWMLYEFGCFDFFGVSITEYNKKNTVEQIKKLNFHKFVNDYIESNKYFFLMCHNKDQLTSMKSVWPNSKLIQLHNFDKFRKMSLGKKQPLIESDWEILPNQIQFDVDSNYLNKDNFLSSMSQLYNKLDIDDFNAENISIFYDKYINVHK